MNLFIIGHDTHDLATAIWKKNTNFTVVECTDIKKQNVF